MFIKTKITCLFLRCMTLACSSGYCPGVIVEDNSTLATAIYILKPRLHLRHFYFTGKTLLSDVAGIV